MACFVDHWFLRFRGVEAAFGVRLIGWPIIQRHPGSRIVLGKDVTLVSTSRANPAGINHPVILATLAPGALISIGEGCGISGASICAVTTIQIGNYCALGANCAIYDTDFHSLDAGRRRPGGSIGDAKTEPITIGNDVWIAMNAILLKGVQIGARSVIGAGAIVTKSVPSDKLVAGVPARVIESLATINGLP